MGEVECLFKAVKLHLKVLKMFVILRSVCLIQKIYIDVSLKFIMQE